MPPPQHRRCATHTRLWAAGCAGFFGGLSLAFGWVINVDFGSTTYSGTAVAPNAGTNWNIITASSTVKTKTVANLRDSKGFATAVSLEISTSGTGLKAFNDSAATNGNPNPMNLMRDYYYGGVFTNILTGIPEGNYLLYVFAHGGGQTQGGTITVIEANGGASGKTGTNSTEYRNLFATNAEGNSYVKLPVTIGTNRTLTFTAGNYLNGYQLFLPPVENYFVNMTSTNGNTGGLQTIATMPGWGYSAAAQVPGETWNIFNPTNFTPPNTLNIGEVWTIANGIPLTTADGQGTGASMTVTYHAASNSLTQEYWLQTFSGVNTVQTNGVMDQMLRNYWDQSGSGNFLRFTMSGLLPNTDYLLYIYGAAKGTSSRCVALIDLNLDGVGDFETLDNLSTDSLFVDNGDGSYGITKRGQVWNVAILRTDASGRAIFDSRRHLNGFQLTTYRAPFISSQPTNVNANLGGNAILSVTASAGYPTPLTYQWYRNGSPVTGAVGASYAISNVGPSQLGTYWVTVGNQGKTERSQWVHARLLNPPADPYDFLEPDGYAAAAGVTGGASGPTVTVRTAAELNKWASTNIPCTILVEGTIDITGANGGNGKTINVSSNKTIQGADGSATIIGCLSAGYTTSAVMENIIIRRLNFYHPGTKIDPATGNYLDGGDGISVYNARGVYITRCTFYDCADGACDITRNSDYVTLSWCKFVYSPEAVTHRFAMILGNTDPTPDSTDPGYRVTLHHNWWAELCHERMPSGSYSAAHIYNNYFTSAGNYYASNARTNSQWLLQNNYYADVNSPVTKSEGGKIFLSGNIFQNCTGAPPGYDSTVGAVTIDPEVVMPTYGYTLQSAVNVPATVAAGAGSWGYFSWAPQTINFATIPPKTLGDEPLTLEASASSGLPVTYTSSDPSVAIISGSALSIVGPGSTTIIASQPGDPLYAAAISVAQTVVVSTAEEVWAASHGLDPATTGAPTADPDGDGLTNAMEFFLGANPTIHDIASKSPTIRLTNDGTRRLLFEFLRAKKAAHKSFAVQFTSDLSADWATAIDGIDEVKIEIIEINPNTDRVSATIPATADRLFLRLHIF